MYNLKMKYFVKLVFLLQIFAISTCVPVTSSGLSIDNSELYKYSYETEVVLNEADIATEDKIHRMHSDVGLKVGVIFEMTSRWTNPSNPADQIIEVKFEEAEIVNVSDRLKQDNTFYSSRKSSALRSFVDPLIFRWTNGLITELYVNLAETVTALNIKRGILGMLQLQTHTGKREEEDPSGVCPVSYQVSGTEVKKIKDQSNCRNNEESFSAPNEAVGVSSASTSKALYTLSDDMRNLEYAVAMESHALRVNLKKDISLFIVGRQKLGLIEKEKRRPHKVAPTKDDALKGFAKEMKKKGEKYIRESLVSARDSKSCAEGCLHIERVLEQRHGDLSKENMANVSSVEAYITAVRAARQADHKTLTSVMKDEANKDIRYTLIDVLAAAQTDASLQVLLDTLDFNKHEATGDIERGLTGIAFSSHPSLTTLRHLTKVFKGRIASNKVRDTVALALGAVLNKVCRADAQLCNTKEASGVRDLIHEGLKSAGGDEATETLYIQFVRNSRRNTFIPQLLHLAEHSQHPLVHHLAITSLAVFEREHLDDQVSAAMNRIYHQTLRGYETTVRSAAANLLLSANPTEYDVINIVLSLPEQKSAELSAFLLARIRDLIKTDHPSKGLLLKVLRDPSYGNYWTLAQAGMASAFTGYMYNTSDSFGTYGLFMEYSNAGMMRRTAVDFSLHSQRDSISLTQLGIVAQGLEGLTGSEPDDGEEDLDSMVGMASSMMGVKLRPLTFFRGYSDMMALIWAGNSGEPAGVEAMLMLTDYLQHVTMASGLRIKTEVIGAISTKITADIMFSLWNRNVQIVTTNGGALSIQCRMTLESPIIRASVRNSLDAKSALEFSVFTDFSSLPPKSCMRLSYPPFTVTKSLRKFERVRGSSKRLLATRRQQWGARGTTLPLHLGNSHMCARIVTDS